MNFSDYVEKSTNEYLNQMTKTERKKIGQFFTPAKISEFMGKLASIKEEIDVLDAGAGSGILTASIIDQAYKSNKVKIINVDLYENNKDIIWS